MKSYLEDTPAYLSIDKKQRVLEELYYNSFRTIKSVYIFKNFEEYTIQLKADKNEDKKDVYWNASYYEKLIDYVKISIAFENYNKAVLIENGYLVHKIKKDENTKELFKKQQSGIPIKIEDFLSVAKESINTNSKIFLTGLTSNFETINYHQTLSDNYQAIICIDNELCYRLKEINEKRNRLHFFTDFKGAYEVNSHIKLWTFIKDKSIETIELPLKRKEYV